MKAENKEERKGRRERMKAGKKEERKARRKEGMNEERR
jgi:hypothetical protein